MAKRKKKTRIFKIIQITPGTALKGQASTGASQPPKKSTAQSAHISMTLIYSPRKKSRKGVAEYSTKKPATSSDSASTRSKGGRLVSASAETKKIGNIGKRIVARHKRTP